MKKENLYEPNCIRTRMGVYVNVFEPDPKTFLIDDIAHSLSQQPRFGGMLDKFYSVAQHCVLACSFASEENRFTALMHDASEAYLMDIPKPIKQRLRDYAQIEDGLMKSLSDHFGFTWPMPAEVKSIDAHLLQMEWNTLMLGNGPQIIKPWTAEESKIQFINAFTSYKR